MKIKQLLELKYIEKNLNKLNESDLQELIESINYIEGCGIAVTKKTPIKDLIKIYNYEKAKLRKHSENDAIKKGLINKKQKMKHFNDCLKNIRSIIEEYLKKTKRELNS